ncbi:MAG: L,D-transpeptidase [Firmicutes bacterium]|nr:L,D-transpeptidase [Bacillota bacterium]
MCNQAKKFLRYMLSSVLLSSVLTYSQFNMNIYAQEMDSGEKDTVTMNEIAGSGCRVYMIMPLLMNNIKIMEDNGLLPKDDDADYEEVTAEASVDDIYFDVKSGQYTVKEKLICNESMVNHLERLNKNMVDIKICIDKRSIPLERSVIAEATNINTGAVDYSKIFAWCKEFCKKYCSATTMRAWNGNLINIPGGDGKDKIKEGTTATELASKVYNALISFRSEEIKAVKALPKRYIECDLSAQKIYWYDDGECSMSTDCVTGAVDTPTPVGTFTIKNNMGRTALSGPTWYVWVNNWAYFSQGCGLHDATWQKSFGLERWQAGYGSHGCINLPLSIANQMRSKTSVGDIIIIHK